MSTRKWLGMSWWNAAFTVMIVVCLVLMLVLGRWFAAIVMAVLLVAFVASVLYARTARASDVTRLNAAEYADERDRAMGAFGLAVVGVTAMFTSMAMFILAILLLPPTHPMVFVVWGQLVLLAVVWLVANWIAVRRG